MQKNVTETFSELNIQILFTLAALPCRVLLTQQPLKFPINADQTTLAVSNDNRTAYGVPQISPSVNARKI